MRGISGNGRGKRVCLHEGKYQGMGEGREGICMRGNIREWEREERAFV